MRAADAVAHAFAAQGVSHVFGIAGDANLRWYAAMSDLGAHMIDTRQELSAVAMAEGYSHVGDKVGVATVTAGPGLVQAGLGLANAARAGVPTVVFAGDNPTVAIDGPQILDQRRFVESCGARYVTLRSPQTAHADVTRAFDLARRHRTSVVLNAPMDIQDLPCELPPPGPPLPVVRPSSIPSPPVLEQMIEAIQGARCPLVLVGRGAMWAGAGPAAIQLAERIGAVTATTLLAKGYLDGDPYCIGVVGPLSSSVADEVLDEVDLVLAFGASLDRFTMYGKAGSPMFGDATVISVVETERPCPSGVDHVVVGDAANTATALCAGVTDHAVGLRTGDVAAVLGSGAPAMPEPADGFLHPAAAMQTLERHLDDRSRVVVGSGHFFSWPIMHLRRPVGGRYLFGYFFGSIGLGLPIGIGAAVGDPESRVVVVEGDGSIMETVQELETASRHRIPVTTIVLNDQQLGAERFKGELLGIEPSLVQIRTPRLDEVARALGGRGALADSVESFDQALRNATEAGDVPFLVDARIDPSILCDMYRKLHFDLPNVAPHQRLSDS